MADRRITELNNHITPQPSDLLAIVNSNETKRITYGSLHDNIRDGVISGSSQVDISQAQSYENVMITGSLTGSAITFTKGDDSTFNIDLGGTFVQVDYLSCYSTGSQPLAVSGSEQVATFTHTWTSQGINLISGSQIQFEEAAAYEFKFVAKVTNADNAVHDVYFWIKYNGNNFPNSATKMTLQPRKSSGEPSAQLMTVSIVGVAQNNNDYIQLYWTGDSTLVSLEAAPASGVVPSSPSIIASVVRV